MQTQTPYGVAHQAEIRAAVAEVERQLRPFGVRHIHYDISTDWSGDWAIFFRVLLADAVTRGKRFDQITERVTSLLYERLPEDRFGLILYWSFRGQSEQAQLQDASWT